MPTDPRPPTTYEVVAVRYGTRTTVKSEVFLNYEVYGEPDAPIGMDYFFWVVTGGGRTVLVDCGYDPVVGARRGRTLVCDPVEGLGRLGLAPGDVDLLVVTHAHYDHIGNLRHFPDVPLLVAGRELEFWTGPGCCHDQFLASAERPELDELRAAREAGRVTTWSDRTSPLPGIELIEVGGHTPGQCIVVVDTREGQAVLASDSTHYYEELDLDRPFTFVADLPAMYAGFVTLRELAARPGRVLVPGHDPLVMERFPPLDAERADIAVRIA